MGRTFFLISVTTSVYVMVVNILWSYSKNLKLLFDLQTDTLKVVSTGDPSQFVPVATNDEFGAIAGEIVFCQEVGGDGFDYFPLPGKNSALLLPM